MPAMIGAGLCLPASGDWPPNSYTAAYRVLIDGKPRLETRVRFERSAESWEMSTDGEGTKGLARLVNATTRDRASGSLDGHHVLTERFSHHASMTFKTVAWDAEFDWENGEVRITQDESDRVFPLQRGMVDPLGLTLEIQSRLERGHEHWDTRVVEDEEVDSQKFRALPVAPLATSIGCIEAVEVQRVRENSKRYSSIWHARDLDWITVRMVHGKRGGNEFEMQITELSLDGHSIKLAPSCEKSNRENPQ